MSNNHSIKILRGTRITVNKNNFTDNEDELYAGQPIYLTDLNYLAIGTADGSNNSKVNKLPIVVREVKGYAVDNENAIVASTVGSGRWHIGPASTSTTADVEFNVSKLGLNIGAYGGGDLTIETNTEDDLEIPNYSNINISAGPAGIITIKDTAIGTNKLGKITITPGNASDSSVAIQNGASTATIKDGSIKLDTVASNVHSIVEITPGSTIDIASGDSGIVVNQSGDIALNRYVSASDTTIVSITSTGMTIGSSYTVGDYNPSKRITGLITNAIEAKKLADNPSISITSGQATITAGNKTSIPAVDVSAKTLMLGDVETTVVVQHSIPSPPTPGTLYLIY